MLAVLGEIEPDHSGVEPFTPYQIDTCLGLATANLPSSPRVITRFCSKNEADLLNSLFTLEVEHSKKLSDTECITFGFGAFQLVIITGIVLDQWGQI